MARARAILTFVALVGLALLVAGHLGAVLPLGNSLSVLRLQLLALAVPMLLLLALTGGRRRALWLALPVLFSMGETIKVLRGAAPADEGEVVLYQKNLLWLGRDPEAVLADILGVAPDFIAFQETSDQNAAVVAGLEQAYPHRMICRGRPIGGLSLFSRHPLETPVDGCSLASGFALSRAVLPDGRKLWIGVTHLSWPWPYGQTRQVGPIAEVLAGLDGPVVVAGDFNMVPWASTVRRIEVAGRMRRLGGYLTTFPQFGWAVPLPIDNVMIPDGGQGTVEVRPRFGSDHRGLVARFSF